MAVGYVYLMTNGIDYKIGLTASTPEDRMKQLQTGSSEQIRLIAYTICIDMNSLESNLHTQFASKRKAGEWFALSEDNLHHVYSIFRQHSINIDMSLIPEIVSKDIEKLMKIDGKRLAKGENTLHDEKYVHIPDYKKIVMEYMDEEEKNIELRKKERAERIRKEEEEQYHREELLREDAQRIFNGEKPLHTFEYKELENWKNKLELEVKSLKWKEEKIEREKRNSLEAQKYAAEQQAKHAEIRAGKPRTPNSWIYYLSSSEKVLFQIETLEERAKKEAEERTKRNEANTAEYQAKQRERAAGTQRTINSWKKYLDESEKHLFDLENLNSELKYEMDKLSLKKNREKIEAEERKKRQKEAVEEAKERAKKTEEARKERAKKEAEERTKRNEANTAEYQAKQRERAAGTARTTNSWKKYLTESEKHLFDKD